MSMAFGVPQPCGGCGQKAGKRRRDAVLIAHAGQRQRPQHALDADDIAPEVDRDRFFENVRISAAAKVSHDAIGVRERAPAATGLS